MRIGTVCYATSRGLGHLAHDFYLHGVVTDVLVMVHSGVPTNEDWYPGAPRTHVRAIDRQLLRDFCNGKDAMLFFETPFDWSLIDYCQDKKIRTYLVPMYECSLNHHPAPHKYICPSLLDMQYFPSGTFLMLPTEYPWRLRERAGHFVHNGGYLGLRGSDGHNREGTTTLIDAVQHVKSPIKLTIRVQENVPAVWLDKAKADPRVEYIAETVPYLDLYATGDVAVGAQKWNGCSLPLQEARASGMLVMNTDRFPTNSWLPREPLISVSGIKRHQIGGAYLPFDESLVHPKDIATVIDTWYGKDISAYSLSGRAWAETVSWEALKPRWIEVLEQ